MDATDATFDDLVIERSRQVPVIADFWAEWCGPCRQLGPVLEREVANRSGAVELVKVDTDANPQLTSTYAIRGIPAVKAFRDGTVVAEFVGAKPAHEIAAFLDALVPSEADQLVEQGDEDSLRHALELQPGRVDAALPLARMLYARGELDRAAALLSGLVGSFAADGLLARLELEVDGTLELSDAFNALDSGATETGLDLLLSALPDAQPAAKDRIRRAVIGVLEEIGPDSELARSSRRRLATALY